MYMQNNTSQHTYTYMYNVHVHVYYYGSLGPPSPNPCSSEFPPLLQRSQSASLLHLLLPRLPLGLLPLCVGQPGSGLCQHLLLCRREGEEGGREGERQRKRGGRGGEGGAERKRQREGGREGGRGGDGEGEGERERERGRKREITLCAV